MIFLHDHHNKLKGNGSYIVKGEKKKRETQHATVEKIPPSAAGPRLRWFALSSPHSNDLTAQFKPRAVVEQRFP